MMYNIVLGWEAFKDWLSDTLYLTHNNLHLVLGVGLMLGLRWVLHKPLVSWTPWLIVLALETLNEISDFARYYLAGWPWTPQATLVDYALTMLPPLGIIVAARFAEKASEDN